MRPLRTLLSQPWQRTLRLLALVFVLPFLMAAASVPDEDTDSRGVPFDLPLLWPEPQRAFLQDGPGLLLSDQQIEALLSVDSVGREQLVDQFLEQDPIPETAENELRQAIARRTKLVHSMFKSVVDDRAKLLFLHGQPRTRLEVDCAEAFKPLEIWSYPLDPNQPQTPQVDENGQPIPRPMRRLVLYRPASDRHFRLWLPIDSKRQLYNAEMEYWLEQWEELRGRIFGGKRFDRSICDQSPLIDEVTGIDGLFGFRPDRPKNADIAGMLEPPSDLGEWSRRALESAGIELPSLGPAELSVFFPDKHDQRMTTRILLTLPKDAPIEPFTAEDREEIRLSFEGHLERRGRIFDDFRARFQLAPGEEPQPIALIFDQPLRPGETFLLRLRVSDEISERSTVVSLGFEVPRWPTPQDQQPQVPEEAMNALGEALKMQRTAGFDSLVIIPPETDIVFGLWRAEALVTGERIREVVFSLDDRKIMSRRRPPFTAELRLETYPKEQVVKVEGFDTEGELVAADEVVVNQPRGELRVRILEPARGWVGSGEVIAKAEVVVPEERRVEKVAFRINEDQVAELTRPPWETEVAVPEQADLTYLTIVATLDDGATAEDVRFLNSPEFLEEVDVNLVELYTTVTDGSGRLARGLTANDFTVLEDKRPQKISRFELVEDLPLTLGIAIDTSGSMFESLGEAQRAAVGFLDNIMTAKDRCFALSFADRPALLMPRTSDVRAVALRLEGLVADGSTSLHDAIVTSLYYYRGVRGRRALVLLSDGEDTSSSLEFAESLEYARRSGVSVFTIGLRIGAMEVGIRRKLEALASETGGRTFFIKHAAELKAVYREIEEELRSQYLIAYSSDKPGESGTFHEISVKVKKGRLKARTIRGYYS